MMADYSRAEHRSGAKNGPDRAENRVIGAELRVEIVECECSRVRANSAAQNPITPNISLI